MALTEEFRKALQSNGAVYSDNVFRLNQSDGNYYVNMTFNFISRTMTTYYSSSWATTLPFSQLDRDVIENIHAYMVEKGKKPLPLPKPDAPDMPFIFGGK